MSNLKISNSRFLTNFVFKLFFVLAISTSAFGQKQNTKGTNEVEAQLQKENNLKLSQLPTHISDLATRELLLKALSKTSGMSGVKVQVESGIVLLEGDIPSQKDAEWLQNLTHRLPHVLTVIDKTEVVLPPVTDLKPMLGEAQKLSERFQRMLPSILLGLLLIVLFYIMSGWINRGIRNLLGRKIDNPFFLTTMSKLAMLPVWLILLYLALRLLGLSTLGATLIGGTGVLGIVLGLAFKGIAENYLAGLLLATRSPFTRGDLILIGPYKGYVQNLNMRGTTIIDLNGNLILIPNLTVIQSIVENQTANPKTRTSFTVGISYQDSITSAQNLIIKTLSEIDGILADPAPSVIVKELGSTAVELSVRIWFNVKENREMRIKSRAMIQTKEALLANGFTIPNETREIIFTNSLKLENFQDNKNVKQVVPPEDTRKKQIQQQAAANLTEPENINETGDPSSEDLLKQAETNPLPTSLPTTDLLKKT